MTRQLWDEFFQNVQLLKPFLKSRRVKAAFVQVNDRAEPRRGESWLGSIVSVLPLTPDQPKITGQVLGSLRGEILCHWESPLQQIQSDSVGGWQLQRSKTETTHTGERRRTETLSRPVHVARPRPSSDMLAIECSAKGLRVDGGTRAAETCQAHCHGVSDKPTKIQFLLGRCKCSVHAQEAQHVLAAAPGSRSSAVEGA